VHISVSIGELTTVPHIGDDNRALLFNTTLHSLKVKQWGLKHVQVYVY